ncbi:MAG TPA: hypothetical protein PK308_00055 [Phycisphaerales bacterium]|nr:hypothetical protein [Phycisphaerales bacterium]
MKKVLAWLWLCLPGLLCLALLIALPRLFLTFAALMLAGFLLLLGMWEAIALMRRLAAWAKREIEAETK